jgi:hypothetical protein
LFLQNWSSWHATRLTTAERSPPQNTTQTRTPPPRGSAGPACPPLDPLPERACVPRDLAVGRSSGWWQLHHQGKVSVILNEKWNISLRSYNVCIHLSTELVSAPLQTFFTQWDITNQWCTTKLALKAYSCDDSLCTSTSCNMGPSISLSYLKDLWFSLHLPKEQSLSVLHV